MIYRFDSAKINEILYLKNEIVVNLTTSESERLVITHTAPGHILYRRGVNITDFYEDNDPIFLNNLLQRLYNKIPDIHPYKIYVLSGENKQIALKIVSSSISIKVENNEY